MNFSSRCHQFIAHLFERGSGCLIFLFCLITYLSVYLLAGFIPINGGAGFDGAVYLEYIVKFSSGKEILGDPYRLMRLPGFLPAIVAAWAGVHPDNIVLFQAFINALFLSFGAVLLLSIIKRLTGGLRLHSFISVFIVVFSWPYLVMPIYYPLLSDHIALLFVIVSIWAWLNSCLWLQFFLIPACIWIMPGLSLVPLMLVSLPFQERGRDAEITRNPFVFFVSLALLSILAAYVWVVLNRLSDFEVFSHPSGINLGNLGLREWSSFLVFVALIIAAWAWALLVSTNYFWDALNIRYLLVGIVAAVIGWGFVLYLIDWSSGFRGPPLFYFMLLQSIAAPAKPLVAHFAYFGPVILVSIFSIWIFKDSFFSGVAFPLGVAFLAYLPALFLGSESRQWIAAFPLAVTVVASNERRLRALLVLLLFSVLLCIPVIFLRDGVSHAINSGLGFLSSGWQYYFGRQGPWMSSQSYLAGFVLMIVSFLLYLVSRFRGLNVSAMHISKELF